MNNPRLAKAQYDATIMIEKYKEMINETPHDVHFQFADGYCYCVPNFSKLLYTVMNHYVSDAPHDDKIYVRQRNKWEELDRCRTLIRFRKQGHVYNWQTGEYEESEYSVECSENYRLALTKNNTGRVALSYLSPTDEYDSAFVLTNNGWRLYAHGLSPIGFWGFSPENRQFTPEGMSLEPWSWNAKGLGSIKFTSKGIECKASQNADPVILTFEKFKRLETRIYGNNT